MSPQSRRAVLRDAGGALAGAAVVGVAARPSRAGGATGRARTDAPTDTPRTDRPTPAVEFDAQAVEADGFRVVVERATLPDGGFVAVHDGGPAGPIIGVSDHLPAGTHRHVAVELSADSPVRTGRELTAVLFRDTDGDGTFDFVTGLDDAPYVVDDEAVYDTALVFVPSATPEPTVEFHAQQVADGGRRVVVERATLPEGGFVAVHEGPPTGPIVGSSEYLPPGAHRYVRATLHEEDRVTDRTELSAVLWRDATGDEDFDWAHAPADEPYLVDDEPVSDAAVVSVPTPTPTPLSFTQVPTATPSATPPRSPVPTLTATRPDGAIPGFGVVAAMVAAGAGAVAARLRG